MKLAYGLVAGLAATASLVIPVARAEAAAQAQQPHMQRAWSDLDDARKQLENATHDKAGHRERALTLVNQALAEVKQGMAAGASDLERREAQHH